MRRIFTTQKLVIRDGAKHKRNGLALGLRKTYATRRLEDAANISSTCSKKNGAIEIVGDTIGGFIFKDNYKSLEKSLDSSNNYYVLYKNDQTTNLNTLLLIGMNYNHHLYLEKDRYILRDNIDCRMSNNIILDSEEIARDIEDRLKNSFPFLNFVSLETHDYAIWEERLNRRNEE